MVNVEMMLNGEKTILDEQSESDSLLQRVISKAKDSIAFGMLKVWFCPLLDGPGLFEGDCCTAGMLLTLLKEAAAKEETGCELEEDEALLATANIGRGLLLGTLTMVARFC